MPLLWKYVLGRFCRIFLLQVVGFVVLMLVMRLNEIARFAAQSHQWSAVGLFTLYQIPYILPFAISIACLTSSFFLMRGLCDRYELSALRAARLSISKICTPLIIASFFLILANFYLASEIHPQARMKSRALIQQSTMSNPIFLLSKSKHLRLKGTSVDLTVTRPSKKAKDLSFVTYIKNNDRLSLILAKDLRVKNHTLEGKNVTIVSSLASDEGFDHLVLENQQSMEIPSQDLTLFLRKTSSSLPFDSLPWRALSLRAETDKKPKRAKKRMQFEQIRRLSYSLNPITFTAIGLAFGVHIGRQKRRRAAIFMALLAAFCLTSVLIGKSFEKTPYLAAICYFLPHPIAWFAAYRYRKRKERGFE